MDEYQASEITITLVRRQYPEAMFRALERECADAVLEVVTGANAATIEKWVVSGFHRKLDM